MPLRRCVVAEATGTGLLVAVVVGSGIFAQRLSPGDDGLQLLQNSTATVLGLAALILTFGPVSGAHFNPVVTLVERLLGGISTGRAAAYVAAQVGGGCLGTVVANLMFDLPVVEWSTHARSSGRAVARRGGRHLRAAHGDPRRGALRADLGGAVRRRRLHRCGLLVHLIDELCQPGRHRGPDPHRHLRRHRARLRSHVRRRPGRRRARRAGPGPVPPPRHPGHGRARAWSCPEEPERAQRCCSCASTTPADRRWRWAGSTI